MLLDNLIAIRKLLENPESWTTGFLALNAKNKPVDPDAKAAVRWCVAGAIWKINADYFYDICAYIRKELKLEGSVSDWSDSTTHSDVISSLDYLIGVLSS